MSDPVLHKQLLNARQKYLQERLPLVVVVVAIPFLVLGYLAINGERALIDAFNAPETSWGIIFAIGICVTGAASLVPALGAMMALFHAPDGPKLVFWGLLPLIPLGILFGAGCGGVIVALLVMQAYRVMRATELLTAHGFPLNRLKHLKDFPNKTFR
ncbi:MAG: hypothetical protein C0478_15550 [Planctomyces sp.]|nr:hypothetical protein [Planctomyces sp.]